MIGPLETGEQYCFRISCRNTCGWSEYSAAVTPPVEDDGMTTSTGTDYAEMPPLRMATLCIRPDQCATPMLVTRGVDSLLLAWPSPESHGPAVDRFEVQRKLILHSAPAALEHVFAGISKWWQSFRTCNTLPEMWTPSPIRDLTTFHLPPPLADSDSEEEEENAEAEDEDGMGVVAARCRGRVEEGCGGPSHPRVKQLLGDHALTSLQRGLVPGTEWVFRVRAHTALGWGSFSQPTPPICTLPSRPSVPECPRLVPDTPSKPEGYSLAVHWPHCCDHGATIQSYLLEVAELNSLPFHVLDGDIDEPVVTAEQFLRGANRKELCAVAESYARVSWSEVTRLLLQPKRVVQGLAPGHYYTFRVRARNDLGWSEYSIPSLPLRTATISPNRPLPPVRMNVHPTDLHLRWFAIPNSENGGQLLEWQLGQMREEAWVDEKGNRHITTKPEDMKWETIFSCFRTQKKDNKGFPYFAPPVRFNIVKVLPVSTYWFRVRCRNRAGWSEWSLPTESLVTPAGKPAKPQPPYMTHKTDQIIELAWALPDCCGAVIDFYQIEMCQRQIISPKDEWSEWEMQVRPANSQLHPESRIAGRKWLTFKLSSVFIYKFRLRAHNVMVSE